MRTDSLAGLRTSVRLLARRHRAATLLSLMALWVMVAAVPPNYEEIYPDAASRQALVDLTENSPAMVVFIGRLTPPASLGQLFAWEAGAYVLWCAAFIGILMTASATRGDEERGFTEAALGAGVGRMTPFAAPAVWVACLLAALATGSGAILSALVPVCEELTHSGAWTFAALVFVVGLAFEALTLLLAQLSREGGAVRGMGLAAFAFFFALRACADWMEEEWLRWFTPFAFRELVDPYGANRLAPLLVALAATLTILSLGAGVFHRREIDSALLPDRTASRRRWHIRGLLDLQARLGAKHSGWWLIALVGLAALFAGMGGAMTAVLDDSPEMAALVLVIGGMDSFVATFVCLLAEFNVMLVLIAIIGRALATVGDERAGVMETTLAQGISRSRFYWSRVADCLIAALVFLAAIAAASAVGTWTQFTTEHAVERSAVYTLSHGFGVLAALGIVFALIGIAPRWAQAAWVVITWSGFVVFVGGLLDLPSWVMDISALGHIIEVGADTSWAPLVVQALVGTVGLGVGWFAFTRRDIPAA